MMSPRIRVGYKGQKFEIVVVYALVGGTREQVVAFTDNPDKPINRKRMELLSMLPNVKRVYCRPATVPKNFKMELQL